MYLRPAIIVVLALGALLATDGAAVHVPVHDLSIDSADLTVLGSDTVDHLGFSVAAGDFNGDGTDDLLMGAPDGDGANNSSFNAGEAHVVLGSTGLSGTRDIAFNEHDFTVWGADAGDHLGYSVAAGDFNGDAIEDLLLGALFADAAGNAKSAAGEAYVIFGSPTLSGAIDLGVTNPNLTVLGADQGDGLGRTVAAGDFNGDTIDDLLLGADEARGPGNGRPSAGEAYVIFGSPTLGGTIDLATTSPDLVVFGADAGDTLGGSESRSLAAGDVNGDSVDDLLLGAHAADAAGNGKVNAGEAYVIFGSPTLGGAIDLGVEAPDLNVLGLFAGAGLGWSVASGDVNGDTVEDFLVGAERAGEAYMIFGSPTLGGIKDVAANEQDLVVIGAEQGDEFGNFVLASDLDGDGIEDLIVGADEADAAGNLKPLAGETYVILGSATLTGTVDIAVNEQDLTILGADAIDHLGFALAFGDLNGDGKDDLVVSASFADPANDIARQEAGETYVFFGSTGGPAAAAVGGVLEVLVDPTDSSPSETSDRGLPALLAVAVVGGSAAGVIALAAGGWYIRRRWLR